MARITQNRAGDPWLFFLPLALSFFGLLMILDASAIVALQDFGNRFYYVERQAVWFILGLFSLVFFSLIDPRLIKKLSFPFFLVSFFFLVLVLFPGLGQEVYGGRRWLDFGPLGFQPAELAKLSLILYLAALFERKREFLPFLSVTGLVLILLLLEPDLGTASIIISTAVCLYFVSGAPLKQISVITLFGLILGPLLILFSPYRKKRLLTFLNSSFDVQGASYHVRQALIALGSGGLFGRGLGLSRQKFHFLPEVTTDSIFAIFAEEFGFLGTLLLISVFVFLYYRGFKAAVKVKDDFSRLAAVGIIICLSLQTLINLGAMAALIPLTGVPLPFISYGGSSLLISLTGMGIVYNISREN